MLSSNKISPRSCPGLADFPRDGVAGRQLTLDLKLLEFSLGYWTRRDTVRLGYKHTETSTFAFSLHFPKTAHVGVRTQVPCVRLHLQGLEC